MTDKQLADIKKVDDEFFLPKMQEVFEKADGDFEKMMAEMAKLTEERNAKVKPLISAEQYTKYIEMFSRGPGGGNR